MTAGAKGSEEVPLRPLGTESRERAHSGDDTLSPIDAVSSPVRPAISCTSLNEGRTNGSNKPRPQFLRKIEKKEAYRHFSLKQERIDLAWRLSKQGFFLLFTDNISTQKLFSGTATRLSIRRGRSNSRANKYSLAVHEPEIQAINSPISNHEIESLDEIRTHEVANELEQVTQLQEKTESFFTKYKLERGSLTAFKREARTIIERDLPLILHRDNIIKVFTDKVCI